MINGMLEYDDNNNNMKTCSCSNVYLILHHKVCILEINMDINLTN